MEQDITKKRQINNKQLDFEFETGNNKEYKIYGIWDNIVYAKKLAEQLLGLYYLVLWKSCPEEENIWEPTLAIQHLQKLITVYHKYNPKNLIAISAPINMTPPIARLTTLSMPKSIVDILIKQKRGRLIRSTISK